MTSPVHIELDKENNYSQAVIPDFQVKYPKVSIDSITREPEETTFAEGTALTFSVKLTNNSSFAISDSFDVDLSVGTNSIKTVRVKGLAAGESETVIGRWSVIEPKPEPDGSLKPYEITVTVDEASLDRKSVV